MLKIIGRENWAKGTKFLVDVARSLVRSVCSYGQECFFASPKTDLEMLKIYEYRALRAALGVLPNTAGTDQLYREAGWLTLDEERRLRCANYVVRTARVTDNLARPCLSDDWENTFPIKARLRKTQEAKRGNSIQSLWDFVKEVLGKAGVNLGDIEVQITPGLATRDLPPITCHYTLKKGGRKSDDLNAAGADANLYISQNFQNYFQVYTDGSVQSDGRTGHAVVCWDPDRGFFDEPIARRDRNGLCTMTVELLAILDATYLIQTVSTKRDNVILTDSLSAMQALRNSKPKNCFWIQDEIKRRLHTLRLAGRNVVFCHVPSHTTVAGNKRADDAANLGCQKDNFSAFKKLTRKEAYKLIRDACRVDEVLFKDLSKRHKHRKVKGVYPQGNKETIRVYRRTKLGMPIYRYYNFCLPDSVVRCPHCAEPFSTDHIFKNPCNDLRRELGAAINMVANSGLSFEGLLTNDGGPDWIQGFRVVEALTGSSIVHLL